MRNCPAMDDHGVTRRRSDSPPRARDPTGRADYSADQTAQGPSRPGDLPLSHTSFTDSDGGVAGARSTFFHRTGLPWPQLWAMLNK